MSGSITWYTKDGDDDWEPLGPTYCKLIEKYYTKNPKKPYSCKHKGETCVFNFQLMQAIATVSGTKKLRRGEGDDEDEEEEEEPVDADMADADKPKGVPVWEERGKGGVWSAIASAVLQKALEAALAKGKSSVTYGSAVYDLNNAGSLRRRLVVEADAAPPLKKSAAAAIGKAALAANARKKKRAEPEEEEEEDDDEDEEEEEVPPAKKSRSAPKKKVAADEEEVPKAAGKVKKLIKKGRGIVDPMSHKQGTHHVLDEGGVLYQCTLNQTNLAGGANNNKFYVVQVLEPDAKGGSYMVFTKWGRVGAEGQTGFSAPGTKDKAIQEFNKKFRDKTKNHWADVHADITLFEKYAGKYHLMDMAMHDDDDDDDDNMGDKDASVKLECQLESRVRGVMEMIADKNQMVQSLKELELNTSELPLGKISKNQIKAAFNILKQIDEKLSGKKTKEKYSNLSEQFYTLIPHDFGMCKPPLIDSADHLKRKMQLLDAMADIEIANKIMQPDNMTEHPLDQAYAKLKCHLDPLEHASEEFKNVTRYVYNTRGETHKMYKLEVLEVFELTREGEKKRFSKHADDPNRRLLWHGSGTSNWMGILSQGLRIAPPEAPVTGYMFGKGVYFADCSTKSANYCRTSASNDVAFMTLNEVALGKMYKLQGAKYMDHPPKGHLSTMGEGSMEPNWEQRFEDGDGMTWPLGKMKKTKVDSSLLYNEFIVYSVDQIRARYLVKLKFNYGK